MMDDPSAREPLVTPAPVVAASPTVIAPVLTDAARDRIRDALSASQSQSTARNYRQDWARFTAWCDNSGHAPLPAHPLTVSDYLTETAATRTEDGSRAYAASTFQRWVAAINYVHRAAGFSPPGADQIIRSTLSGIQRTYAENRERPTKRRAPLLVDDIKMIVATSRRTADTWQKQMTERRDSAIILIGWAGAYRRSEIARMHTDDIVRHRYDGLHLTLGKSKTDQHGQGFVKAIPYTERHETCSACAYLRWLQALAAWESAGADSPANAKSGRSAVIRILHDTAQFDDHVCHGRFPRLDHDVPVFRAIRKHGNLSAQAMSGATVHAIVRRRAEQAGFEPELVDNLGGHSLRAGFVTQAFRNQRDAHSIMKQTGHKDPKTLEIYSRDAPLNGNAVNDIGL